MLKTLLKNTDYLVLFIVLLLFVIGVIGIYSAGYNTEVNKNEYIKQMIWFLIMIVPIIVIWSIDYKSFDILGYTIYFISIILLVLVLFTSPIMGARRWFNFGGFLYQPSELVKLGYILCLAKVLSIFNNISKNRKNEIIRNLIIFFLFIIPFTLIVLQPDLGTAITLIVITFFMLFASGIKYRYIIALIAIVCLLTPLIYMYLLTPVQQNRILVFLNPTLDPLGIGYNAIQSKMAVGSGMIFGTGFMQGTQTQFGYLPIKSSDFIFSVLSEEFGFLMSSLIVILFVILLIRLFKISNNTNDLFAKYVVIGIIGFVFFHVVQNIGMTMGLLPITGAPLPFVSYGGSSLITNLIAIAIVLNISARKNVNFLY